MSPLVTWNYGSSNDDVVHGSEEAKEKVACSCDFYNLCEIKQKSKCKMELILSG